MKRLLGLTSVALAVVIFCSQLPASAQLSKSSIPSASHSVQSFLQTLKRNDYKGFCSLVSPIGLVVIRNFCTGNGTRGKDVRMSYTRKEIPKSMLFPVDGETPIDPKWLFPTSLDQMKKAIPVRKVSAILFSFKDDGKVSGPNTVRVRDICSKLLAKGNGKGDPEIFVLGDNELVLTEMGSSDFGTGGFAVFKRDSGTYYLRAILDFR